MAIRGGAPEWLAGRVRLRNATRGRFLAGRPRRGKVNDTEDFSDC